MTTTQPRVKCEVPACSRTRVPDNAWPAAEQWWLCPAHNAKLSPQLRRVLARHRQQFKKFGCYLRPEAYRRARQRAYREAGVYADHSSAPAASGIRSRP